MAGDLMAFGNDWLEIEALWFVPGDGFQPPVNKQSFMVYVKDAATRHLHLSPGIQLVCTGEREVTQDSDAITLKNAKLCFRPEVVLSMPWDSIHLFADGIKP